MAIDGMQLQAVVNTSVSFLVPQYVWEFLGYLSDY
jgi:hypothetical protein